MSGSPTCGRSSCGNKAHSHGLCGKHNRAAIAAGLFDSWTLVDVAEVRAHVIRLNAAGMSYEQLAAESGVSHRTLRRMPALGKVRHVTASRILSVPVPSGADGASALRVDATATVRRLRGMVAIGHSQDYLAERLGMITTNVRRITRGVQTTVTARRERQVLELFNELQLVPGTSDSAREFAAARGWAPTLAWDEDTIADPAAKPDLGPNRPAGTSELITELQDLGVHDIVTIATRLEVHPKTVKRQLITLKEAS